MLIFISSTPISPTRSLLRSSPTTLVCSCVPELPPTKHWMQPAKDAFELSADELRSLSDINTPIFPNRFGDPSRDRSYKTLIDVLLICANETPDLEKMLPFLARRATIVLMSIQQKPLVIPYMPFILPGHRIIASTEASRQNHLAMIQFAARHQISPWVERYPMTADGLKIAFERLEKGEMRFRGVLEVPAAGI